MNYIIKECSKLYGVLLGQMSETSQIRISEMPSGKLSIEEYDPLGVLSCVISTHINNKRYGDTFNMTIAIRNYLSDKMTANEDLAA